MRELRVESVRNKSRDMWMLVRAKVYECVGSPFSFDAKGYQCLYTVYTLDRKHGQLNKGKSEMAAQGMFGCL